ncbi:MAG: hypothetical protein Q4G07_00880 [Oscillospiraceae bacterium]|nr:hypothetical protein [Oscillospiraceae bacterium]
MEKLLQALDILQREEEQFRRFYAVTSEMLICPEEELNVHMEERSRLQKKIEALEKKKKALRSADKELDAALSGGGLSAANEEICVQARKLQGTLYQISRLEQQVIGRLEKERNILEKKIRENNQGPAAKASRFLVGEPGPAGRGGRIGKA